MQLGPSRFERQPLEDAKRVVESLQANGTVDKAAQQAMAALKQDPEFRAQVRAWMAQEGYVAGRKDAKKRPEELARSPALEAMARAALADMLTGSSSSSSSSSSSDPQQQHHQQHTVAAENQLKVHLKLIELLEQQELELQAAFERPFQQHLQHLQPQAPRLVQFNKHEPELGVVRQQQQQQIPPQQQQQQPQQHPQAASYQQQQYAQHVATMAAAAAAGGAGGTGGGRPPPP